MPSFKTAAVAVATMLVAAVQADYVIDPSSVPMSSRRYWCDSEIATCPIICEQTSSGKPITNTCDPKALTYGCVCSDNKQPNISEYTLTLPYFTCTEWGTQCVAKCGSNNDCSRDCREKHPCGALNPQKPNETASASQSATKTGDASPSETNKIFNGLDGSGSTDNKPKSAAVSLEMANLVTLVTVAAGVTLGFGYIL
ncbi:hypothetical protein PG990_012983 [Apiospora arundinis]|jgi:hypothetical protein